MSRWGSALRIARRDALRHKGRSLLVVTMIAVPVLAVTGGLVVLRTVDVDPEEGLAWRLGAADALVTAKGRDALLQDPVTGSAMPLKDLGGDGHREGRPDPSPWTEAELLQALPAGSRLLPVAETTLDVQTDLGAREVPTLAVDLSDPVLRGRLSLLQGRAPGVAEAAVTPELVDRGFTLGSTIVAGDPATPLRVVGVFEQAAHPSAPGLVVHPDSGLVTTTGVWLVDSPRSLDWSAVHALNMQGLEVVSRALVLDPPPRGVWDPEGRFGTESADAATVAVLALVGTALLLEVVLLAGPAFAVGVRRQRRILAMVAACGGSRSDLRRVVLASGLVLGGGAALTGVALGLAVPALAFPVVRRIWRTPDWPYDVDIRLVAVVAAVGLLSGLAAAYLPARQAGRTDVVSALGGRRRDAATRLRFPMVGAVLAGLGLIVTIIGVDGGEWQIAMGTTVSVIGLVLCTPWIVGIAGRAAPHLPLGLQIAARDAARNRQRTAPAVAAILAAVTGITALAIGGSSDFAERRLTYSPAAPVGSAWVHFDGQASAEKLPSIVAEVLPGRPVVSVSRLPEESAQMGWVRTALLTPDCVPTQRDPCEVAMNSGSPAGPDLVGGADLLDALVPEAPATARETLVRGGVVVFSPKAVSKGRVTVARIQEGSANGAPIVLARAELPAAVVTAPPRQGVPSVILSPVAAAALGEKAEARALLVDGSREPVSTAEEERLNEVLAGTGSGASVQVERGFSESFAVPFLVLGGVGTLLVVVATLTATGLARADAQPDLATLAAVGASPRTNRAVSMGQAAVVAGLGCLLGLAAGFIPGIAVTYPLTTSRWTPEETAGRLEPIIDVPWLLLGLVGVVVPLVAVLTAGFFSAKPPNLTRRLT